MRIGDIPDKDIPSADPAIIVQQYEGWINRIVNRYSGLLNETGAVDREDMIQAGNIGLLEAIKSYDPSTGKSFAGWSFLPIRNSMLKLFGYDNPDRKRPALPLCYLDEPVGDDETEARIELIEDPNCIVPEEKAVEDSAREEIQIEVREAVDRLKNEQQQKAIKQIWFDGKDKKSIAAEMGITPEAVSRLDLNARNKLCQDQKLKRLAYPIFRVGLSKYNSTFTSAVEEAVLWREKVFDSSFGNGAFIGKADQTSDN